MKKMILITNINLNKKFLNKMSNVIEITDEFDINNLYQDSKNKLIVIDFYTDWCGPCKRVFPIYSKLSLSDDFKNVGFYKCNGEGKIAEKEFDDYVDRYPTFLIIKDEKIVDKFIGTNIEGLEGIIRKHLTTDKKVSFGEDKIDF